MFNNSFVLYFTLICLFFSILTTANIYIKYKLLLLIILSKIILTKKESLKKAQVFRNKSQVFRKCRFHT